MLPKYGFLILLACIICTLLIFTFMEKDLWSQVQPTNSKHFRATYDAIGKLLTNTKIIIEPVCNASFLAWIITSYAGDVSARSALRRAYTDEELQALGIRRVFLLGILSNNAEKRTHVSRAALLDESQRFNDIILGDFLDTYRNLTHKHLMGLQWIVNNCKDVKYVMKMDDDIVINIYGILEKLHLNIADKDSFTGYTLKNMIPIREPTSKWYVSEAEYTGSIYPNFVSGWLYIIHLHVAKQLIEYIGSTNEYFWIDDVFVTGILRQALNKKICTINELYTTDHRYLECCIKGKETHLKCEFLIGPNGGNNELQVNFKEFAKFCHKNCSIRAENNSVSKTCVAVYKEPNWHTGTVQIDTIRIL